MKKLNLGCGNDIREGWINLDIASLEGVDIVHDLNILPLPFENEEFDYIICYDILEHIFDYIPLLKELHRIVKKDAIIEIKVPHYTYSRAYVDPTHIRYFAMELFYFFVKGSSRAYYFDFSFNKIESIHLSFQKSNVLFYNRWVEKFINKSERHYLFYEKSFLSGLVPAENILVKLRK
ncbi:methyltransferase domain-containing protein [bacterium]|nr:methyltransferase domain-containing protein [bacterium]